MDPDYEVIVVGGGPAGLSGALALARYGRRVLVCDDGHPRNASSAAVHGFLTRDGVPPAEFLQLARTELARYPSIHHAEVRIADIEATTDQRSPFLVKAADGRGWGCRKILLATGLVDELPPIEGLSARWGRSVFPCPFCDAWEFRQQPMAVLADAPTSCDFTLELLTWTRQIVFLTHGGLELEPKLEDRLARMGIRIEHRKIRRLEGPGDRLEAIRFEDDTRTPCRALFLLAHQQQRSPLPEKLGRLPLNSDQLVSTSPLQATRARGVFVAGNASDGLQVAILAAAEGFKAAYAINDELIDDLIADSERNAAPDTTRHPCSAG
jgi:thioredoxin reductase